MSRFVIADLTDATEIRAELLGIVPHLPTVPVQPIILASQEAPYATFQDYKHYHWVLEPFAYDSLDHAIASLTEKVLKPAETKSIEMRR
jgi:hypothetical protein